METEVKTQWHPAFCSSLRLELRKNRQDLEFLEEHTLNRKPLLMDLLVIKKESGVIIKNELGSIFRTYNIWEYKSPDDHMNIDTFFKVMAYASLYKTESIGDKKVDIRDISISFLRHSKPVGLFKKLEELGYRISRKTGGIYYMEVMNGNVPVQFVVTNELNRENHIWVTSLMRNLSQRQAEELIRQAEELSSETDYKCIDSLLQVVIAENNQTFFQLKEADGEMCDALKELMRDEIEQSHKEGIERGIEQGIEQGELIGKIKLLYQDFHMSLEDIAKKLNVTLETVQEILDSRKIKG